MINYTYESLFRQDSIDKQIHIVGEDINLANEDIFQGSFSLTEELNTEEDLVFGSCVSSCLIFTTSAIDCSFIGKFLTVSLTINGHSDDDFNIGVYRVYEEKWTANRTKKEIVAYDRLYDINNMDVTDWYNALTFPISLANFRNSFFNYIGITQKTATLVNDSFMVQETILPKALSGAMVLHAICELNGVFGRINRDNQFEYTQLGTSSVYSINPSMYTECKFEDYSVATIDKVTIRQEENDIGGSYGSGDNALIIQGNFLAYGSSPEDLTTVATNIYSVVSAITYTPCEISCIGNPCVEIGDLVTIQKRDETTFTTYVLSRTLDNIQSMKDELSALGNKYRVNEINSVENDWLQLLGKTNKLTRTVEETISEVSDLNGSVTTLTQTSDYLVSEVQSINRELNGENLTWQGEGEPTLLNYPYWDFTSAFKCDGTKRCAPIYNDDMTEGGEQYPHHYYSEQDRQDHVRDLYIDLDTGNGYRFVKTNGVWNWQLIADSDFSILFNQITELRQDVDSIDLNVQNDEITIADHESRITHNEGELTTQAGLIRAKVSEHTQNGDNSFSFDLLASGVKFTSNSTDVLTINASGIKIQGNAEFTGKITAKSGYIGNGSSGFTIANTSIYNSDTNNEVKLDVSSGLLIRGNTPEITVKENENSTVWNESKIDPTGIRFYSHRNNNSIQIGDLQPYFAEYGTAKTRGLNLSLAGIDDTSSSNAIVANLYMAGAVPIMNGTTPAGKFTPVLNFQNANNERLSIEIDQVYAPNAEMYAISFNQTSDRRKKKDIEKLDNEKATKFILSLKPCEFKMKEDDTKHHGFIAQEIKESMYDDWDLHKENDGTQYLSYTELIADMVATIQSLQKQINKLKEKVG